METEFFKPDGEPVRCFVCRSTDLVETGLLDSADEKLSIGCQSCGQHLADRVFGDYQVTTDYEKC